MRGSALREAVHVVLRAALGVGMVAAGITVATRRAPKDANATPIPSASSARTLDARVEPPKGAAEGDEVAIRLVDELTTASVVLPDDAPIGRVLQGDRHRTRAPWVKGALPEDRRDVAQVISLRMHDATPVQAPMTVDDAAHAVRLDSIEAWSVRECLVAPTPSSLRFHLRVPRAAALEVDPGVVRLGDSSVEGPADAVHFVARAWPSSGGEPIELGRVTIAANQRGVWMPQRWDLAALAGKEIDLELRADADARPGLTRAAHAVAAWGAPRIVRRTTTRLPYSVLWIVVDALRPDVIAAMHDDDADAKKLAAKSPPGKTLLPKVPGLMPSLDALAKRSTIFRRATSATHWTRPGTIAMLTGDFADYLGVPTFMWVLGPKENAAWYASRPPLVPLAFREAGATVRAIGNNHFLYGWDPMGVDMGFETYEGFEHDMMDTEATLRATLADLRAHPDERTFRFVNFNSPHYPLLPTKECLARLPKIKEDSVDAMVTWYMAEACKDDAAIGKILDELDRTGARAHTLVIVTADHGETLSWNHHAADATLIAHAIHQYEETTRVPIMLSLPGVIPEGKTVDARVSSLDLAPTVLKLEGLDADKRQRGIDLIALANGAKADENRPILTIGRGTSGIILGKWRYVSHDIGMPHIWGMEELYDLEADPGETYSVADHEDMKSIAADMRAKLKANLALWRGEANDASTTPAALVDDARGPQIRVRFATRGRVKKVEVRLAAKGARSLTIDGVAVPKEAIAIDGAKATVRFETRADAVVGFDLRVMPVTMPVEWTITIDGVAVGDDAVFGGALGVTRPELSRGLLDGGARVAVAASRLPLIDPAADEGVFVVRDPGGGEGVDVERTVDAEANAEVAKALKSWGYAK